MKSKIMKMGNSTGICIPKIILEQCHMEGCVDIQIRDNQIIISELKYDFRSNICQEKCFYTALKEIPGKLTK